MLQTTTAFIKQSVAMSQVLSSSRKADQTASHWYYKKIHIIVMQLCGCVQLTDGIYCGDGVYKLMQVSVSPAEAHFFSSEILDLWAQSGAL